MTFQEYLTDCNYVCICWVESITTESEFSLQISYKKQQQQANNTTFKSEQMRIFIYKKVVQ